MMWNAVPFNGQVVEGFSVDITNIHHGFNVVMLTVTWYCGRNKTTL